MTTTEIAKTKATQDEIEKTWASDVKLKRYRFMQPMEDYRPAIWPIPWPYWCSGTSEGANEEVISIMVVYGPDDEYIRKFWPESYELDPMNEDIDPKDILFSGRFPRPDWYKGPGTDYVPSTNEVVKEQPAIYIGE